MLYKYEKEVNFPTGEGGYMGLPSLYFPGTSGKSGARLSVKLWHG